jgi:adenosylmethionine-8-amino-7-oxononanoate aminotransferase
MITTSKGISGGYAPLAVLTLRERVWQAIAQGSGTVMQSCTYGGNPVSCAAGVATLEYIEAHDLVARAAETGAQLMAKLQARVAELPHVGQVRGQGLFIGIEIVADRATKAPFPAAWQVTHRIEEACFERGLLILGGVPGLLDGMGGDHFELLPPYVVEEEHLDFMVETVRQAILKVTAELPAQ